MTKVIIEKSKYFKEVQNLIFFISNHFAILIGFLLYYNLFFMFITLNEVKTYAKRKNIYYFSITSPLFLNYTKKENNNNNKFKT